MRTRHNDPAPGNTGSRARNRLIIARNLYIHDSQCEVKLRGSLTKHTALLAKPWSHWPSATSVSPAIQKIECRWRIRLLTTRANISAQKQVRRILSRRRVFKTLCLWYAMLVCLGGTHLQQLPVEVPDKMAAWPWLWTKLCLTVDCKHWNDFKINESN
jgi:hypothetical protein